MKKFGCKPPATLARMILVFSTLWVGGAKVFANDVTNDGPVDATLTCNCQGQKLIGPIPDARFTDLRELIPLTGIRPNEVTPLVINGTPADPNQFRNVGLVLIQSSAFQGTGICTGTLIDPEWVLTAAHCVTNSSNGQLHPNLTVNVEFSNGASRSASLVIPHPTYVGFVSSPPKGLIIGDICLLKLSAPINDIATAAIQTSAPFVGQNVTLVGYGNSGKPLTGQLSGTAGIKRFGSQSLDRVNSDQTLWDFRFPEQQSIAQGDSGGPQLNGSLAVVSVTSGLSRRSPFIPIAGWRSTCFNTRADIYFTWMQDTMSANPSANPPPRNPTRNLVGQLITAAKANPFLAPFVAHVPVSLHLN